MLGQLLYDGASWSGQERNCLFLNTGAARFATVSAVAGFDAQDDGRAMALTDWDHDGDLDVWLVNRHEQQLRYLRNNSEGAGRYVVVELHGDGVKVSRDAIGARVTIVLKAGPDSGPRIPLIRSVRAGDSFLSQSSKRLHFGIGPDAEIDSVTVRWPDGRTEQLSGIGLNGHYQVNYGSAAAQPLVISLPEHPDPDPIGEESASEQSAPNPGDRSSFVLRPAMPEIGVEWSDGNAGAIVPTDGKPVLISLWASWCAPCLKEIADLSAHRTELEAAGLTVTLLNIEGLGGGQGSPAEAREMARELGFPFRWGFPAEGALKRLMLMHHSSYAIKQEVRVPTSFLVDGEDRLAAIYHGNIDVHELLQDVAALGRPMAERRHRATPYQGIWKSDSVVANTDRRAKAFLEAGEFAHAECLYREALPHDPKDAALLHEFGICLQKLGKLGEAVTVLEQALASAENRERQGELHTLLGRTYQRLRLSADAEWHFREAVELNPGGFIPHYNLGAHYAGHGLYAKSLPEFRKALEADPSNPEAWNYLGVSVINLGDLDEARRCFEKAIEAAPEHGQGYNNLGLLLEREGKNERARKMYEKAHSVEPSLSTARANLSRLGNSP